MEELAENYIEQPMLYGGFWRRIGAQILDGILLGVILFPANWYDLTQLKNYPLYLSVGLVGTMYKPIMEHNYGATLGKMAFGLKCTNDSYGKIGFAQALNRNVFFLIPAIAALIFNYFVFECPAFSEANTLRGVGLVVLQFPVIMWVNNLFYLFWIIDAFVLASDNRKRSLHDRWANTFVIYMPSE